MAGVVVVETAAVAVATDAAINVLGTVGEETAAG
jgi:hypothetical protein